MKSRNFLVKAVAWLILPAIIIASIIAVSAIRISTPVNPLDSSIRQSDLEETGAGELELPENVLSSENDRDKRSDSNSKEQDNALQSDNSSDVSSFADVSSKSYSDTSIDSRHTGSESSDSSDSSSYNANIPSDERTPSPQKTDDEYFTTSIKDGETVSSRSYSFSIHHKKPELKVKSTDIYVNGKAQAQFNGRVLLEDGKNKIRVEVTYTDKDAKAFSVFRDYTVNVSLGGISLRTDLKDCTVDTSNISFNASAVIDGEELPVTVQCNGNTLHSDGIRYTAMLLENDNTIVISSSWHDKSISKTFHVIFKPSEPLEIVTTLENCTVNDSSFSFSAYIKNASSDAHLSVSLNGTPLASGTNFNVSLSEGSNFIHLKAYDIRNGENVSISQDYTIKYIPLADEATAPKIEHINITDGMTIKGCDYNLDILPRDFEGKRIYYSGIAVKLNGTLLSHEWDGKYTSYSLYFKNGTNRLQIRITDKAGRYADYIYDINCIALSDGDEIGQVTISVDANVLGLGTIIANEKLTIHQGESVDEAVLKYLEAHGFTADYSGSIGNSFYLSRIYKNGIGKNASIPQELASEINSYGFEWTNQHDENSIGEMDYTQGSGWLYSINDSFPNYSLSKAVLKDGDTLRLRFTLAYGKDVGGGYELGDNGNFDRTW